MRVLSVSPRGADAVGSLLRGNGGWGHTGGRGKLQFEFYTFPPVEDVQTPEVATATVFSFLFRGFPRRFAPLNDI